MNEKATWPKYLLVPSEKQFKHGDWIDVDASKITDMDEADDLIDSMRRAIKGRLGAAEREDLKYHCGTSCCLVGWAALAFGEDGCCPSQIRNPATTQFLNKFLEFAGRDPVVRWVHGYEENFEIFSERVGREASDAFEGADEDGSSRKKFEITPRKARDLWKKTGDHFGYDMGNLLEG